MPTTTANYSLPAGVETDDFVQPEHHNRVAETLDRVVGLFLKRMMADGAYEGWLLQTDKRVSAGEGLVGGCWCTTTAPQAITGLVNGETNHVCAATDSGSAPEGTVAFFAQLGPTPPAGAVSLGTLTLDVSGEVTNADSAAPGVDRNCYRLEVRTLSGSGSVEAVPPGATVTVVVDHTSEGALRLLGPVEVDVSEGFTGTVTVWHEGTRFEIQLTNNGSSEAEAEYSWRRTGLMA